MKILAFLMTMLTANAAHADTCSDAVLDLRGPWGQARFAIELADDTASRATGLMHRAELASSQGMLFAYDSPGAPTFWMKNTLIALDMLFITPEGVVQHVHSMAVPHDLTPISGGDGILMVLEIRGGMAAILGISAGSEMRHPALDPEIAIWPCEMGD